MLSEIVKYESYIDSLQRAMALRMRHQGEKALERALRLPSENESEDSEGESDENTRSPSS